MPPDPPSGLCAYAHSKCQAPQIFSAFILPPPPPIIHFLNATLKWPRKKDCLFYDKADIKLKIMPLEHKQRGAFKVPELKDHWENF